MAGRAGVENEMKKRGQMKKWGQMKFSGNEGGSRLPGLPENFI